MRLINGVYGTLSMYFREICACNNAEELLFTSTYFTFSCVAALERVDSVNVTERFHLHLRLHLRFCFVSGLSEGEVKSKSSRKIDTALTRRLPNPIPLSRVQVIRGLFNRFSFCNQQLYPNLHMPVCISIYMVLRIRWCNGVSIPPPPG